MTKAAYKKESINWEVAYSFRVLVHGHQGRKHDCRQVGMALEQ